MPFKIQNMLLICFHSKQSFTSSESVLDRASFSGFIVRFHMTHLILMNGSLWSTTEAWLINLNQVCWSREISKNMHCPSGTRGPGLRNTILGHAGYVINLLSGIPPKLAQLWTLTVVDALDSLIKPGELLKKSALWLYLSTWVSSSLARWNIFFMLLLKQLLVFTFNFQHLPNPRENKVELMQNIIYDQLLLGSYNLHQGIQTKWATASWGEQVHCTAYSCFAQW